MEDGSWIDNGWMMPEGWMREEGEALHQLQVPIISFCSCDCLEVPVQFQADQSPEKTRPVGATLLLSRVCVCVEPQALGCRNGPASSSTVYQSANEEAAG